MRLPPEEDECPVLRFSTVFVLPETKLRKNLLNMRMISLTANQILSFPHTCPYLSSHSREVFFSFFLSLCFAEWASYRQQVIAKDVAMATTNLQGEWWNSNCCDNSAAGIRWVDALCLASQGQIRDATRNHQNLLYHTQYPLRLHTAVAFLHSIYRTATPNLL